MLTIDRPPAKTLPSTTKDKQTLLLNNGDRISRNEFECRYMAIPNVKKAELIEGVVYMSSEHPAVA